MCGYYTLYNNFVIIFLNLICFPVTNSIGLRDHDEVKLEASPMKYETLENDSFVDKSYSY